MSDAWTQSMLVPPTAVEIRIRCGFVPESDHAQVMLEIIEPSSRVVLGQWARPHIALRDWDTAFEEAVQRANAAFQEFVEPF